MPRRRMIDMRNPYGSRGGYVSSRRSRRDRAMEEDMRRGRDRLMMDDMRAYNRGESDYELADLTRQNQEIIHDPYMPRDYETGEVYAGLNDFYGEEDMARNRREYPMPRMNYNDGHYPMVQGYIPVEAMGRFTGYYGMGEDNARYGRRVRDYARYGRKTYDYDSGMLGQEEIMEWSEKLKKELEDKDKQYFSKENIKKKAEEMGIKFDKFSLDEFYLTVLMVYTDYCKTLGTANMDIYLRLAKDWLEDDDVKVKGGEKLATYHDYIVEGDVE